VSRAITGWRRALAVCGAVVLVDQVSKAIVVSTLAVGQRRRTSFSAFTSRTSPIGAGVRDRPRPGFVLAVTIVALALVLVWFAVDPGRPELWLAVGLLAGGALGNLADRVRADAVTDFIDPPLWPTFNLADVAITLGAVGLVLISLGLDGRGIRSAGPGR
jgi:signal peptidase II